MTSATIGIKQADGSVRATRVNADGYPAHAGAMLALHYHTPEQIEALLALGELSVLDKNLTPPEGTAHTWANPAPETTIAYHRDRGEKFTPAKRYGSVEEYLANAISDTGASYAYLFDDGKWFFRTAAKNELFELNVETAK